MRDTGGIKTLNAEHPFDSPFIITQNNHMAFLGAAYQNLCNAQATLYKRIERTDDDKAAALMAKECVFIEKMKREMRGIAPLAPSDRLATLKPAKPRRQLAEPVEIDATPANPSSPEGISLPATVPTPPSQEPPASGSE